MQDALKSFHCKLWFLLTHQFYPDSTEAKSGWRRATRAQTQGDTHCEQPYRRCMGEGMLRISENAPARVPPDAHWPGWGATRIQPTSRLGPCGQLGNTLPPTGAPPVARPLSERPPRVLASAIFCPHHAYLTDDLPIPTGSPLVKFVQGCRLMNAANGTENASSLIKQTLPEFIVLNRALGY